jgi:hypothetical protein
MNNKEEEKKTSMKYKLFMIHTSYNSSGREAK